MPQVRTARNKVRRLVRGPGAAVAFEFAETHASFGAGRERLTSGLHMSMILQEVLAAEDLDRVRGVLSELVWASGKRTAGVAARDVKENLQADGSDARVKELERFVVDALRRHPLFEIAARPARISRLLFSRYEPGMTYGAHTDDALMGVGEDKLRTDLAFTIFLADSRQLRWRRTGR
jgi:predicted 2-oxoglutarate/Fe(II)-dependent dioxygenase YbiX